jgi:hypothetical protein
VYLSAHPGRRDTAEREPYVPTEDKAKRKEEGSEGAAIAGDPGGCCRYRYACVRKRIGATLIHVAVGPRRDEEPVRTFETFTRDLQAIAVWR